MIDPPGSSDAAALADWAELWLLTAGADAITREQIKRELQDEPDEEVLDDDDDRVGAEIEVAQLESMVREDTRVDRLLAEIARRAEAAPRIYRLRSASWSRGWRTELFPTRMCPDKASTSFSIGSRCPKHRSGTDGRAYSDGGVDVIAWRHFADGRAGFPIILGQCTIQFEWRPKTTDIVLDLWGDWIRFVTPAQKALVVPFAIPERKWWRDRTRTAGIILDRMRLCELLNAALDEELEGLEAAGMSDWLTTERETFVAALAA